MIINLICDIPLSMIKFPMKFEMSASATSGVGSLWNAQGKHLSPIVCAIPVEFNGPGGGYSPEDLFGLALLNCLFATFKVYAEKSNLQFQKILGRAVLTADRILGEAGFSITQADLFIDIEGAADQEKAKKLLDAAIKDCAISNSIKTGKTFHINIS